MAEREAKTAGWVSLLSNLILTIAKILVGLYAGSEALFADGVHSAVDVLASIAALSAVAISYRPPDLDHPYGHGRAEDMSSIVVAGVLLLAALGIVYSAVRELTQPVHAQAPMALYVAGASLALKEVLFHYTRRRGQNLHSPALLALAEDHRTDIWGSWAALVGIGAALLGQRYQVPLLGYGDPVAGLAVAGLILMASQRLGMRSLQVLMDHSIDARTLDDMRTLVSAVAEVERVDGIRARTLGHYVVVDVLAAMNGRKTIQEGHDAMHKIKYAVMQQYPEVREVLVHLNPYYAEESTGAPTEQ